jgi:hypothetical protein
LIRGQIGGDDAQQLVDRRKQPWACTTFGMDRNRFLEAQERSRSSCAWVTKTERMECETDRRQGYHKGGAADLSRCDPARAAGGGTAETVLASDSGRHSVIVSRPSSGVRQEYCGQPCPRSLVMDLGVGVRREIDI